MKNIPLVTKEEAEANPRPKDARIVVPNAEEMKKVQERMQPKRVCGECVHFNLRQGQREIRRQGLVGRLVNEEKWDLSWVGPRFDLYGLCDHLSSDDQFLTHATAPARVARSFLDSDTDYESKDESLECPFWEKGGKFRRKLKLFMGGGRTYDGG